MAIVPALLLTGCGAYVEGGYGGGYVYNEGYYGECPGPDIYVFGGNYDRGRDVRAYSHRGAVSRSAAHSSGGSHRR